MIPVLGIPVISGPDMLRACVRSIDAPVGRLVIVDNSPTGGMVDAIRGDVPELVGQLVEVRPPDNLGFAGSLNFVIRTHAWAAWWMFANHDSVFAPGDMGRVAEKMTEADGPFLCGILDFRLFGLNAECVETIGFWDENLHPMYCEDTDYVRRMTVGGGRYLMLLGETGHYGSATIRGDERYSKANARTYPSNRRYYTEKWGGDINQETFATPFDRGGSVADWTLRLSRLRDNTWTPGGVE